MSTEPMPIDPALLRGLTQRRFSRRDMLRYAGVGAGAAGLASILAACGVKSENAGASVDLSVGTPQWWSQLKSVGHVNFTNWPQYIDVVRNNGKLSSPTLTEFTTATGITVTYRPDINDNDTYYATIQPALSAGTDTGQDIIVITDGTVLTELIDSHYLIPLDHSLTPNFNANAGPTIKNPAYDPNNQYTMAWQSGFTGIGWNKKFVTRDITSFNDLLDPAFKGKVGMMGNTADLPNMALVALGIVPKDSTPDDWQKAADLLTKQKDSGVVRKYYFQDYLTAFENEDIWITMAWSGDILIDKLYYGYDTFEFIVPKEGGLIWTDNMCIPQKAAAPLDAIKLMDWYYKPDVAAKLTEFNNYVGPVPAAQAIVQSDASKATGGTKTTLEFVAKSPYVFPTATVAAEVFPYRVLTADEETTWNNLFQPIFQT